MTDTAVDTKPAKPAKPKLSPIERAQANLLKAQAAIAKAQAAEANSAFNKLFTAWADHKGHSDGKGNRRASNMAVIAEWEADMKSGLIPALEEALAGTSTDNGDATEA